MITKISFDDWCKEFNELMKSSVYSCTEIIDYEKLYSKGFTPEKGLEIIEKQLLNLAYYVKYGVKR